MRILLFIKMFGIALHPCIDGGLGLPMFFPDAFTQSALVMA